MMEVFAGFLTHTDHHIGRLLDFLDAAHQLDNTLVILLSDNGASAEGGPNGTFNENFLFNGLPHDLATTMRLIDKLGGPDSYGHYPWGWAYAGNTPFKRWKRETHEGGIGDPLIIAGLTATSGGGADTDTDTDNVRHQYVHATDVAATILDACGVSMPEVLNGVAQEPLAGASFTTSFREPAAAEQRTMQYYEQFACRALYHHGWKAVAYHPMAIARYSPSDDSRRPFDEDIWELYHVAIDPSESNDLAASHPEKLEELKVIWWEQARLNNALPLQSDRAFAVGRPHTIRERSRYELRQGAAPIPEEVAPNLKLRPHSIVARFEIPSEGGNGVLLAQGGKFGGFSLWIRDNVVRFTYNFAGIETHEIVATTPLGSGSHIVGVSVTPAAGTGMDAVMHIDGAIAGEVSLPRTSMLRFTLAGEGMCCGYDDGTAVGDYSAPFAYNGRIDSVTIDVSGAEFTDVVAEVERAWRTQ